MATRLLFLFIMIVFASVSGAATLTGTVTDSLDGTPIEGALIQVALNNAGTDQEYAARSNDEGMFRIENLPSGTYTLSCESEGYQSRFMRYDAQTGLHVRFRLIPRDDLLDNYVAGHVYSTPHLLPAIMPLEGATISLEGEVIRFSTRSDRHGFFKFQNLPPGWYFLSATAPGHEAVINLDTLVIRENTKIRDLEIFMVPENPIPLASLSGVVKVENSDRPIHPAVITLIPHWSTAVNDYIIRVKNKEDGTYVIRNIPAGVYQARCEAEGYQTAVVNTIELNANHVQLDFSLKPENTPGIVHISGKVLNMLTELPVYNARVDIEPLDIATFAFAPLFTFCDDEGNFHYRLPAPGRYVLRASHPGFATSRPDTVTLTPMGPVRLVKLLIKPLNTTEKVKMGGIVYHEDTEFRPVYPAQIVLVGTTLGSDSVIYSTQNRPDGTYLIGNIRPANYTVWCYARGYERKRIRNVNLYSDTRFNFALTPIINQDFGAITGTVYFDGTRRPVHGAILTFFSDNAVGHMARTDENGFFEARLPVGKYFVSCVYRSPDAPYAYQEYYDDVHTLAEATAVGVRAGTTTPDIDFGIPVFPHVRQVVISGTVYDNANEPLRRSLVKVWPVHPRPSLNDRRPYHAWTDENGEYKITIYFNALWTRLGFIVSAQKRGYKIEFYDEKPAPYLADILWTGHDTVFTGIDFTLDPVNTANSINGMITDETGAVLNDVFVFGFDLQSGNVEFAVTDSSGLYSLESLHPALHLILFAAEGYIPEFFDDVTNWQEAMPVLAYGTVNGIDASLSSIDLDTCAGFISGQIRNSRDEEIPGAVISAHNDRGRLVGFALSDAGGYYQLPCSGNGVQVVQVNAFDYATETSSVYLTAEESNISMLNFTLNESVLDLPQDEAILPSTVQLSPNYPNPFNPVTNIEFVLPAAQNINLVIYNLLGQRVKTLLSGYLNAGRHVLTWNGSDAAGRQVASGLYFLTLQTSDRIKVQKMIFSK